ncbi:hypothetical protein GALMADRAFT_133661 [Galerina marginata CBS 339.88]|uniref:Nephrocystin 3-like N-terminal domain-containing protein n=1 Tax=Galerina marginata (strain CBS 339.88) TaxID=685588 RepID=A0A067TWI9_GALM3|nr:hypothetical protein GALMADRAFT_133661 [Galerina marginata CBS 339.88]
MPSFRKFLGKTKDVFHPLGKSPKHQSQTGQDQRTESLSKNAEPSTSCSTLPTQSPDGTQTNQAQAPDTIRLGLSPDGGQAQFLGDNSRSSQQSLSTTHLLTPAPWEAWTLDQGFLYQVYSWNAQHPESSLDRIFDKFTTAIEQYEVLLELIPDGLIPIRGFVKALTHVMKLGMIMVEAKATALQFVQSVVRWVEKLATALAEAGSGHFVSRAWTDLSDIRKLIEDVCAWAHRMLNARLMERTFVNEKILDFRNQFSEAIERFGVLSNIHIAIGQDRINRQLETFIHGHDRLQQGQQILPKATFQVQNKIPCDPGTRKQVLAEIMKWVEDISDSSPCLFWLSGDPGVGKSAVTASIAQECKHRGILWAQFFINRNDASTTDPQLYFPTIVKQMSQHNPAVDYAIQNVLEEQPDLMTDDMSMQATGLFLKAVRLASESTPREPVVIVIDALDETDLKRLKLTTEIFSLILLDLPPNVKVFISSRVETVIRDNFNPHPRATNIHLSARTSVADVTQFLEAKVHEIMTEYHIDWSCWGHERMRKLCSQASGLFIWAVTAIEYIRSEIEEAGRESLDVILDELNVKGMDDINTLYRVILKRIYRHETDPWDLQRFQRIVGAILAQRTPLSIADLQGLLDLRNPRTGTPVDVEHFVRRLRTLLVPGVDEISGRTFPRVHKSFADFITSARAEHFRVDMTASNGELAIQCINQLTQLWKRKMPLQLRYARIHWSSHFTQVVGVPMEREETNDETIADVTSDDDFTSGNDAQSHMSNEENDPGPHGPIDTQTTKDLFMLRMYSVICVSPDGTCAAYASYDSIILRDTETGDFIRPPLTGHVGAVRSATFSPDGRLLVSGAYDKTIRIWDVETGELVVDPLIGHTGMVLATTFSPDGNRIVSSSENVRIWDAKTGKILHILEGHTDSVWSAFFSPDSNFIISSSNDETIRIWNATTGAAVRILSGHSAALFSAIFSSDGRQVLSFSIKGTIIVWDLETGQEIPNSCVDSALSFTGPESSPYIYTPQKANSAMHRVVPSTPFYSFRVAESGISGGVGDSWLYMDTKNHLIMSTYMGQLIIRLNLEPTNKLISLMGIHWNI